MNTIYHEFFAGRKQGRKLTVAAAMPYGFPLPVPGAPMYQTTIPMTRPMAVATYTVRTRYKAPPGGLAMRVMNENICSPVKMPKPVCACL